MYKIIDINGKKKNRNFNFVSELRGMRKSYMKNVIILKFNRNSFKNKVWIIKKIADSFPNAGFEIDCAKPRVKSPENRNRVFGS